MDKYRLFDKILKTKACTYYKAESIDTRQNFIAKRLNKSTSWEQILKNKDISTMKNAKIKNFPNIQEIVKDEQQFYLILEQTHKNLEFVIKTDIEKDTIFKIGRLLVQLALNLSDKKIYPRQIRPSHLFIDEAMTILKLYHLETYPKDIARLDLVELQDLRYLSPQQVLTTKEIDERSLIFNIGIIICDLIIGKSIISANTKMQYIYQLTRLFPQEKVINFDESEQQIANNNIAEQPKQSNSTNNFDNIIKKYNFSNEFIAMLKQMLKIDRSERVPLSELLDAWDVVAENEKNYAINQKILNDEAKLKHKNSAVLSPTKQVVELDINFEFQQKPTLSTITNIKTSSVSLATEKNVQDDTAQPIIIKKSKQLQAKNKLNSTKQSINVNKSVNNMKNPSLPSVKRPQLTNYAMNEVNLGVQMGMNPSIFSQNDH